MESSSSRHSTRVMVDTSVLISGTVWPRWPHAVLQHALVQDFQLVLAPIIIEEGLRVLREKFPRHVTSFMKYLEDCQYEEAQNPSREEVLAFRDLVRDVNDVPIALAAINSSVDCFVSEDKDFTERNETTAKFHERIQVYLSGTFLREVMGWNSEELESIRKRAWKDVP